MNDIPLITEISIMQNDASNSWICYYKVREYDDGFRIRIDLNEYSHNDKKHWAGGITERFIKEDGWVLDFKKSIEWENHILYQCVNEIKKFPEFRIRSIFMEQDILFRTSRDIDFIPAVYGNIKVTILEKENDEGEFG